MNCVGKLYWRSELFTINPMVSSRPDGMGTRFIGDTHFIVLTGSGHKIDERGIDDSRLTHTGSIHRAWS
jgi:hypothetical protein